MGGCILDTKRETEPTGKERNQRTEKWALGSKTLVGIAGNTNLVINLVISALLPSATRTHPDQPRPNPPKGQFFPRTVQSTTLNLPK